MPPLRQSQPLFCSYIALLVSLTFLAGLPGCGPASDNAPNLGPRPSVGGQSLPQTIPPLRNNPAAPAASSVASAADKGNGAATAKEVIPGVDSSSQGDRLQSQSADTPSANSVPLIPDSIIQGLNSPDARVRLQAMSHWGSKGTTVALDPLLEAIDDEDPAVQAKAIEIIERYWAAEQERERS